MIVALSISPSGTRRGKPASPEPGTVAPAEERVSEDGVSEAVAAAVRVIRASGLPCETNSMFTNIEGDWDEVMAVVKQAVEVVAGMYPRVGLVLKADIRPGHVEQMSAKVHRVEQHLDQERA